MSNFREVRNSLVMTRSKSGVFRELPIYQYKKELFAKSGSGFYKLYSNFCTSADSVKWSVITGVEYSISIKGGLAYTRLEKA